MVSNSLKATTALHGAGKTVIYTGPAEPTAYDPGWIFFRNLTAKQKTWFQAHPRYLIDYAADKASALHRMEVIVPSGAKLLHQVSFEKLSTMPQTDRAALLQTLDARWQALQAIAATVKAAITVFPPTVTKREHVDAAFKILSPSDEGIEHDNYPR